MASGLIMMRGPENSPISEIEDAAAKWVARRDAGLSPVEERELQRWVDAAPRHRAALGFYDSAWSALAKPSRSGAGAEFEREMAALARRRRHRRIVTGTVAVAVLVGVSLTTLQPWWRTSESAHSNAMVQAPTQQTLPDGSVVEFKGSARIGVEYTAALRRVVLREGEAHFAVEKDPARPFVVSAGGVEVRAVGTAFSVQLGSTSVDVLVTAGRVVVDRTSAGIASIAKPLAAVEAGKRVVVAMTPSATVPEVRDVLPDEFRERLAWRSRRLEFTRTPLAEAVALLNQHSPSSAARLVIADAKLAPMRISGVFRPDNTEAFVLLLEGAFGVRTERAGNSIALYKAE